MRYAYQFHITEKSVRQHGRGGCEGRKRWKDGPVKFWLLDMV